MEFFQTTWRDGSAFNHGLTSTEYFYDQIYKAMEHNVKNKTVPFLKSENHVVPVELSTGKLINDENLIALEQIAAKKGYKSDFWIYGSELEKLQHEGISLNLKKGAEPALCITKYANPTHLNETELYIAEGGAKTKSQFLYNFDSLDERSQKAIQKYFNSAKDIQNHHIKENYLNYAENLRKIRIAEPEELKKLKATTMNAADIASKAYAKAFSENKDKNINLSPLINAQARHICECSTGSRVKNQIKAENENLCYGLLEKIFTETKTSKAPSWKVGQALTMAMEAGSSFARSYTSKNFNLEVRKNREENKIKTKRLNYSQYSGVGY